MLRADYCCPDLGQAASDSFSFSVGFVVAILFFHGCSQELFLAFLRLD